MARGSGKLQALVPVEYDLVESRYRLLVESITDYAIYMLDADGIIVSWNLGAERLKGYTADEIVGRSFEIFYPDEARAASVPKRNLDFAARDSRYEDEGCRLRKDGSRFWASVVIDRISDDDGTLLGFAKITRDLTERRAHEEALRKTQEQFRLLVKGVTDYAIFMLDADGNIISWNVGAERMTGYAETEIIGQHFSKLYTEDERVRCEPKRNLDIARAKGGIELEGLRLRKDGSVFAAHIVIDAVFDANGALMGFAKVTRDISARREAQKQLEKAREALFQAQKLEAIGQLTGGVAHDFNNLLMAISGSLEIVARRMDSNPKLTPFIQNAIQAAKRGAVLTQRMLAFARRQELKTGAMDLISCIRDLSDLLARVCGPGVSCTIDLPVTLPLVHTDRSQFESAVMNLVVNARDAMPDGGSIRIQAEHRSLERDRDGGRDYVVLSVSDTGEGMNAATLARAVEPFFTTKGVGKGTGLGLSMVHGLAEQSGGTFRLSSTPGNGTVAELWLPLAAGHVGSCEAARTAPTSSTLGQRTILVVDDDALVLLNTVTMIEDLGHIALEATSAQAALDILAQEHVDLLVTDYVMPKMTGGQLAATVTAKWPETKILITTGYAEMPKEYLGSFERLTKPFTEGELKAAIESLCR